MAQTGYPKGINPANSTKLESAAVKHFSRDFLVGKADRRFS